MISVGRSGHRDCKVASAADLHANPKRTSCRRVMITDKATRTARPIQCASAHSEIILQGHAMAAQVVQNAACNLSVQRPASFRCCRSALCKNREHRLDIDDLIAGGTAPRAAYYLHVVSFNDWKQLDDVE